MSWSNPSVPSSALPPLFRAAGELTVCWGLAEAALVSIVSIIHQKAGGRHLEQKIPVSFSRRCKFLRLCFRQIGALAPYAAEITPMLDKMGRLAALRNAVVHGAVESYDRKSRIFVFANIKTDDKTHTQRVERVRGTSDEIRSTGRELLSLCRAMGALAKRLMQTFVP